MLRFGEFVHSLGGKYITAEDVGMATSDMDLVRTVTPYVTGFQKTKEAQVILRLLLPMVCLWE